MISLKIRIYSKIQDGNKKGEHYYEEILYTNQFIHIPINGM